MLPRHAGRLRGVRDEPASGAPAKAKAAGVYKGGKRRIDRETILAMKAKGRGSGKFGFSILEGIQPVSAFGRDFYGTFEEAQAAMCAALTDAVGAECPLQDGQGGRSGAASSSADVQQ